MHFCDQCDDYFDTSEDLRHHLYEQHTNPS